MLHLIKCVSTFVPKFIYHDQKLHEDAGDYCRYGLTADYRL